MNLIGFYKNENKSKPNQESISPNETNYVMKSIQQIVEDLRNKGIDVELCKRVQG
ncbi:hypothetical protein [Halalkalibacter krulwichiae]|uniref:Uncharacterized protein n=1 Tax=Halalkalibacter krulwichiae TaxID=199441 RepID=A0A1X9MED8_9BACI|nr:hypothetical protein [Halalkalibacter krulwichiae]ARK30503.1 hypothetical protein BkAM31D_12055 [Halalkalibacter krulwichiae]